MITKIEFELSDVLSQEEIKQFVKDATIEHMRKKVSLECDRLLSNTAYYASYKMLDDIFDCEQKQKLQKKVLNIMENLSEYTVFFSSYYERRKSLGLEMIETVLKNNKCIMEDRLKKVVEEYNYEKLVEDNLQDRLMDVIRDKLETRKE
jgi:uncharacterized membrane-anchored protein YjiN (DUF445 family)